MISRQDIKLGGPLRTEHKGGKRRGRGWWRRRRRDRGDDNGESSTRREGEFTKERVNGSTVRQMVGSSRDLRTPFPLLFPNDEGRSVPVVTPRKISSNQYHTIETLPVIMRGFCDP